MSTKYNEYKGLNLPEVAKNVLEKWENQQVFEKSMRRTQTIRIF
jgi:isoleucyl-tRNA synthetase